MVPKKNSESESEDVVCLGFVDKSNVSQNALVFDNYCKVVPMLRNFLGSEFQNQTCNSLSDYFLYYFCSG